MDTVERKIMISINQLRQWLNEDRVTEPNRMVSNEQILNWLEPEEIIKLVHQQTLKEVAEKVGKKMKGFNYTSFGQCMYCKGEWVSTDHGKHDKGCPMGKLEDILKLLSEEGKKP